MIIRFIHALALPVGLSFFWGSPAWAAPKDDEAANNAWRSLAGYHPKEAEAGFTKLVHNGSDSRSVRLGQALGLLGAQPVTADRLAQARDRLVQLAAGDDDPALAARYFLGRITQNYLEQPDYESAAEQYRQLAVRHHDTYWGQLALSKLAILILYVLPMPDSRTRIAQAEALLPQAGRTTARDLHLMIGDASLFHGLPREPALRHLLAAVAFDQGESPLTAGLKSDLLVQIIRLSTGLGHLRQAEDYAQQFREAFPRDWRLYTIEQILLAAATGHDWPGP